MNYLRFFVLALIMVMTACASLPGRQGNVDAVLSASGIDSQLAWLRQPLQTDKTEGPLALIPDEWILLVNSTVAETLKPDVIRDNLRSSLEKNLSGSDLAEVQKFYESSTGRQVVALESGKLDAKTSPSSLSDSATLNALANATGAGKAVSQLAEHGLNDAVDIALKHGCLGHEKIPLAGLLSGVMKKAQLLALRNSVNESIRQRYASLSAEDQAAYLAFAESRAGQKFFATRTQILGNAAQRAGDALSSQLTRHISELCKASS